MEAGACGDAGGSVRSPEAYLLEEEDVYKMKELIREQPGDVLKYIEEEGVVKLAQFDVQVSRAHGRVCVEGIKRAFTSESARWWSSCCKPLAMA